MKIRLETFIITEVMTNCTINLTIKYTVRQLHMNLNKF